MKKVFLAILLSILMMIAIVTPAFVAAEQSETSPTSIRVIGWNVLGTSGGLGDDFTVNKRGERSIAIINKYMPDSIGFQESTLSWRNFLTAALTKYTVVPASLMHNNAIFYNAEIWELVEADTFWLSETPDHPSKYPDANEERACTYAIFQNKKTGERYAHFNTHLDHVSDHARTYGIGVIIDKIAELRAKAGNENLGIAATGDYNGDRNGDAYQAMVSKHDNVNMKDALFCAPSDQVENEGATMLDANLIIREDQTAYDEKIAIDHIFVSIDQLDVRSYKVIREGETVIRDGKEVTLAYSDHFAVCIDMQIGEGEVRRSPVDSSEKAAYGKLQLDGEKDAAYSGSSSGKIKTYVGQSGTLPEDEITNASYSFAHDGQYLYYLLEVTDHHVTPAEKTAGKAYNEVDGVEVYYNFLKGSTNPNSYAGISSSEAGYFNVYANGGPADRTKGMEYISVITTTGYRIEGRIPLSDSMKKTIQGTESILMGIGFLISDDSDEGEGGRDYFLYNTGSGDVLGAWSNPAQTLPLYLEPAPVSIPENSIAYGTPELNGALNEVYGSTYQGAFAKVLTDEGDGTYDTNATYRYLYDESYLYYFVDVTHGLSANAAKYQGLDKLEIYFNFALNDNKSTSFGALPSGEAGYFDIYSDGRAADNWNHAAAGDEFKAAATYVHALKSNGYTLEGRIPLSESMKKKLADGDETALGMSIMIIADTDGDGARNRIWGNYNDILASWGNPTKQTLCPLIQTNKPPVEEPLEYQIILPEVEGLHIEVVGGKMTAKSGDRVTLDIRLDDGYEFLEDCGYYDYGHFSNSQQKWVYFLTAPYYGALAGRRLKVNGVSLPWSGNSFIMPKGDATITAEVGKRSIASAPHQDGVVLDGQMDAAYSGKEPINVNGQQTDATAVYEEGTNATGKIYSAHDDQYLYCFAAIKDPTKTTMDAIKGDVNIPKSLIGFDNILFFFDFLNTDDENVSTNQYSFVEGESGMFLIDSLDQKAASDGRIYNKLGGGFASYNGDKNAADYVVVETADGYNVELKIKLSDSAKQKIANSKQNDPVEIGIGAVIMDDRYNDGCWEYDRGECVSLSSSLMINLWKNLCFIPTGDGQLQIDAPRNITSPRWLARMVLEAAEDNGGETESSKPATDSSQAPSDTSSDASSDASTDAAGDSSATSSKLPESASSGPEQPLSGGSANIFGAALIFFGAVLAAAMIVVLQVRRSGKKSQ